MAEQHGKIGAIYYSPGYIRGTTISFYSGATEEIRDSASGFVTAGFTGTPKVTVTGSTSNNGVWTVTSVAAGALTVSETIFAEVAGDDVTVVYSPDATLATGFYNWSLDYEGDVVEVTDFGDSGVKAYIAGGKGWTATAERNWEASDLTDWTGSHYWIRFFTKWVTTPSGGDPAYYYEGLCETVSNSIKVDCKDVNRQTFKFTGSGSLTLVTRTTAWDQ